MKKEWIARIVLGVAFLCAAAVVKATAADQNEAEQIKAEQVGTEQIKTEQIGTKQMEAEEVAGEVQPVSGNEAIPESRESVSGNEVIPESKESVSGNEAVSESKESVSENEAVSDNDLSLSLGTMYLTFDDGPAKDTTDEVLDTLQKNQVKATFFVIGEYVRKYPETAKRIVAEGHTIGIHCNNHDYDELYKSADSYIADFEEAWLAVKEVTGVEPKLFRFPGGSVNAHNKKVRNEIIKRLSAQGYVYVDWNASLEDAVSKAEPEQLIQNARETTLGRKKVIMLAHDRVSATSLCLDDLIAEFSDYKLEPLSMEVEPIQFAEPIQH